MRTLYILGVRPKGLYVVVQLLTGLFTHENQIPGLNDRCYPGILCILRPDSLSYALVTFPLIDNPHPPLNANDDLLLAFLTLNSDIADGFETDSSTAIQKWTPRDRKPHAPTSPQTPVKRVSWRVQDICAIC